MCDMVSMGATVSVFEGLRIGMAGDLDVEILQCEAMSRVGRNMAMWFMVAGFR